MEEVTTLAERPNERYYFMNIADLVSMRSTCLRRSVGAVAVYNKRILATGYNGAPTGIDHCAKTGCLREKLHIPSGERAEMCRAVHAEMNVVVQAAYHGISIKGADIYCTTMPCAMCMKMLINCGISRIIYREEYNDKLAARIAQAAHLPLIRMEVNA